MPLRSLCDLVLGIREAAAGRGDLLVHQRAGASPEALSASDAVGNVHALALALEGQAVGAGERVAIWADNQPEWLIVDLAVQLLGAVTVPLPIDADDELIAFLLRNSGAGWVFYDGAERRARLDSLLGALATPPRAIAFAGDHRLADEVSLTRLMGEGAARRGAVPIERFRNRVAPEDRSTLLYLMAAAGDEPRRLVLRHREVVAAVSALGAALGLGAADRALSWLPLAGPVQRTVDLLCLSRGIAVHHAPAGADLLATAGAVRPTLLTADAEAYLDLERALYAASGDGWRRWLIDAALAIGARHAAARDLGFVGPLLAAERGLADRLVLRAARRRTGGRLRLPLVAGALPAAAETFFAALGMPLLTGLVAAEAGGFVALNRPGERRLGSLGRALPGIALRPHPDGGVGYRPAAGATAADDDAAAAVAGDDRGPLPGLRLDADGFVFADGDHSGV